MGLGRHVRSAMRRFGRDEDGSMIIFAMFLMLLMLIVGGMAVDLMRFETNRSRLQATLDRAVLAAADLDQTLPPRGVVEDYFQKAGLYDDLTSITVTQTVNSRTVGATASMGVDTMFMDLVGIRSLEAPGAGEAAEAINDIEIVLVLDVSGSMASNSRLVNLQAAARDFVATILQNDTQNRISIAMVPFNGQVNLGPLLRPKFNVTDLVTTPANVNCVDLPASVYSDQSISRTAAMPATQNADTFSTTNRSNAYYAWNDGATATVVGTNVWCPPSTGNVVRLPARSVATLQANINALTAVGATSINAGMRWGMTLLDPASRPMFNEFIGAGQIPSFYAGRPYDWRRDDTMKVIVLLSDGEHFAEERVNAGYRGATVSDIWRAAGDQNFSRYEASRVDRTNATTLANSRPFWVPHLSQWQARPWNGTSPATNVPYAEGANRRFDVNADGLCNNADDGRGALTSAQACWGQATQQTWGQVWGAVRMHWVAWQLYGRPLGSTSAARVSIADSWMNTFRTQTATTAMDGQLQQMCQRARDENVDVYTISFEAPTNGRTQLGLCATVPSMAYDAAGLQIGVVFRAIAGRINALRLTQ